MHRHSSQSVWWVYLRLKLNWIYTQFNIFFLHSCVCMCWHSEAGKFNFWIDEALLKDFVTLEIKMPVLCFHYSFLCIFIEQTRYIPKYVKIQKQQPEPIAAYTVNLLVWCLRGRKQCLCCLYPVLMSWHPPRPVISVFISTNTNTFNQRPPHITGYHHVSLSMGRSIMEHVLAVAY